MPFLFDLRHFFDNQLYLSILCIKTNQWQFSPFLGSVFWFLGGWLSCLGFFARFLLIDNGLWGDLCVYLSIKMSIQTDCKSMIKLCRLFRAEGAPPNTKTCGKKFNTCEYILFNSACGLCV